MFKPRPKPVYTSPGSRNELEKEFEVAIRDVESRRAEAHARDDDSSDEYGPPVHRTFTPGEQRRLDLIDIRNFPEDYEGETLHESLKRLELKRRHLKDPVPVPISGSGSTVYSNPHSPVPGPRLNMKWSKKHRRPKKSGASFGNPGNTKGVRRKSVIDGRSVTEVMTCLLERNEQIGVPSAKLTDDQFIEKLMAHFPMGKKQARGQYAYDDIRLFRWRYNKGVLFTQLYDVDDDGKPRRLPTDINPPRIKSRRYVRLGDGRVLITSVRGKKLIPYVYTGP